MTLPPRLSLYINMIVVICIIIYAAGAKGHGNGNVNGNVKGKVNGKNGINTAKAGKFGCFLGKKGVWARGVGRPGFPLGLDF